MRLPLKAVLAAAFLLALLAFARPVPVDDEQDIWLELTPGHTTFPANTAGTLPDANLDFFRIVIAHQPSQVNYGSIVSKINTEAANIVMRAKSTSDGIFCEFDLARRGGFRLHPGRNSVEIAFFDSRHRLRYASFLLNAPEAEPDHGGGSVRPPDPQHGKRYAVVVGISKYQNSGPGLPDLQFADRDAKAFYDLLISPNGGGFAPENVRLLMNRDASLGNLQSAFSSFLAQAGEDDTVLFFFAGHGGSDRDDEGVVDGKPNVYLVTSDVDPGNIKGTALSISDLQRLFEDSVRSRHLVTFADSCRSLGLRAARDTRSSHQNNLVNQYVARFAGAGDRAVITASDVSQISQESERWDGGHGVFTYFLLRGLKGEADLNDDGAVTVSELFVFVRDHVYKETGGEQRPVMHTGLSANLSLRTAAPARSAKRIQPMDAVPTKSTQPVGERVGTVARNFGLHE